MSAPETFWSRRRAQVAAEAQSDQAAAEAELLAAQHAALEERPDDEILAELKLPDPDSLGLGDDFSVFMASAVPDRIRRRALRVLWRSNPVLANVDSLVDYGQDFTDSAMAVENIQTAYQVGKGMLKHIEELARQAEERGARAEAEAAPDEDAEEDAEELVLAAAAPPLEVPQDTALQAGEEEAPAPSAPRRMKFRQTQSAA